ncbi:MAG TPA: Mov34/MPN/PAD-1 family protein [Gaiellaceae bacterium]|nr:Mov34/MPN/PAD-1 family protein [Gaiellaceae bacterium]
MVVVPAAVRRELEAHADAEAPNEACGLLALRDGVAERFLPGENTAASPYRFELKPGSLDDFFLEDEGYELAVFHSHPTDKAEPSRTDVENIGLWEGKPYLILSRPTRELRAWRIAGGKAEELELE